MAMTEDMEFPRLTPYGGRLPSGRRLFRRPEELTDDQFDLLAAAWADDALRGDSLAETEEAMASSPERKIRAESFRKIRLSPLNDRWEGRNRMLKTDPGTNAIRRTLIVTLTVAAALTALVILGPLVTKSGTRSAGPAVAETEKMGEAITIAEAQTMSEALIAEASPVIRTLPAEGMNPATQNMIQTAGEADSSGEGKVKLQSAGVTARNSANTGKPVKALPQQNNITASVTSFSIDATSEAGAGSVTPESHTSDAVIVTMHDFAGELPILAAGPEASRLAPVELRNIIPLPAAEREENWIVRGLSLLAGAITKEPKNVDGYFIANACVRGVNRVLGWEMELEQEKNHEGELLATNFSSSLLTFTAPTKKTHP
jgi:hypothetical protein